MLRQNRLYLMEPNPLEPFRTWTEIHVSENHNQQKRKTPSKTHKSVLWPLPWKRSTNNCSICPLSRFTKRIKKSSSEKSRSSCYDNRTTAGWWNLRRSHCIKQYKLMFTDITKIYFNFVNFTNLFTTNSFFFCYTDGGMQFITVFYKK